MNKIQIEILEYSYWEHFKQAKDLAMVLSLDHPRRLALESEINKIRTQINKLKSLDKATV